MYSFVLMMALGQAPMTGTTTVVTQEPAQFGAPVQYAPASQRRFGLLRRWRMGRRSNYSDSSPVYYSSSPTTAPMTGAAPMPSGSATYRSNYPPLKEPTPARMVVILPPNAMLTVNGEPTKSTGGERVFETPPLKPGKAYTYELTARVPQPGGEMVTTQRVQVVPGQDTQVVMEQAPMSSPTPGRRRLLRR
jgi:uncharacterized protein (TIGR03000 family)